MRRNAEMCLDTPYIESVKEGDVEEDIEAHRYRERASTTAAQQGKGKVQAAVVMSASA
jgi:hypothetical protein